ncbi:MAG: hypothetical protein HY881_23875 [Deltaproteobacteria bacterium]|nr:hypothetical protein [Deltaproteobacteria bacterium]
MVIVSVFSFFIVSSLFFPNVCGLYGGPNVTIHGRHEADSRESAYSEMIRRKVSGGASIHWSGVDPVAAASRLAVGHEGRLKPDMTSNKKPEVTPTILQILIWVPCFIVIYYL